MFVVKRGHHNPVIMPTTENLWSSFAAFNWCPIKEGKLIRTVYRAMGAPEVIKDGLNTLSTIGYAESKDEVHFTGHRQLIVPTEPWEKYGVEDPRIIKFEGKYYIFYTALSTFPFSASGIKIAVGVTKDLNLPLEKHLVTPFNAKAMVIFPERINGKIVAMLTVNTDLPPAKIAYAYFDREEDLWNEAKWNVWYDNLEDHVIDLRRFPGDQVEVGAPPIRTSRGWLFIYSHIQNYQSDKKIFGIEALLLDLKNPEIIIGRTKGPLLVPEEIYELYGHVPNITFPSGALIEKNKLTIYYGAADTSSATASVNLDDLENSMIPETSQKHIHRFSENPILTKQTENAWEAKAVFNPAAIELEGKIHLLYRAMANDNTSTLGYASTKDGFHINERLSEPAYVPREGFEMKGNPGGNSGVEDARLTKIKDKLYMTYTAYDGVSLPKVAVTHIEIKDFLAKKWNWAKPIVITPAEIDDKDSCLFPETFGGKYLIFHRIGNTVCGDYLNSLNFEKEKIIKCIEVMKPRPGMWDGRKVGITSPPIKTKKGWLLFYHGVSDRSNYRVGAALLDLKNPTMVISRTSDAFFSPETKYEIEGQVPNVVFPCGIVLRKDTLFIYYGGADQVVGVATMKLSEILDVLA